MNHLRLQRASLLSVEEFTRADLGTGMKAMIRQKQIFSAGSLVFGLLQVSRSYFWLL